MSAIVALLCAVLLAAGIFARNAGAKSAENGQASNVVLELKIDGEVEPILATYIDEGIADAAYRHAALVLITMDTPGGLSDSMKDIIQHILASPVPVAVYVSPTGARGASAGFLHSALGGRRRHGSGTHTGAASPLIVIGGLQLQVDETMQKKILNDATAFLRSYPESAAAIRRLRKRR